MQQSSKLSSVLVRAGLAILMALLLSACHGTQTADNHDIRPSEAYFKTPFHNECEFIVQSVTTDIAEMAWYAKFRSLPQPKESLVSAVELAPISESAPKYRITTRYPNGTVTYDLTVNGAIWSPEVYQGFTKALFNKLGLAAPKMTAANPADTALISSLLNLTATNIAMENQALSASLKRDFLNPVLHEKAAVLVGAFALRENSGMFYEIRSPLCRMSAHLAIARALAGGATDDPNTRLAEVLLDTLMNNEKEAVEKIAQFNTGKPELEAWSRALYARNTHDFRPLGAVKNRSLLETIEYFRASCNSLGTVVAWDALSDPRKTRIPDFARIVNTRRYSVEMGHVMARIGLPLEMREVTETYKLTHDGAFAGVSLTNALNEMPDRCLGRAGNGPVEVHVLGWGQWAAFCQRHVCHTIQHNWDLYQNMWGVPREAHDFAARCEESLHGLRLYPFVQRLTCTDKDLYKSVIDDAFLVTQTTPQLVPAEAWNYLYYDVSFAPRYTPVSPGRVDEWHSHNPPTGTAYNPRPRLDHSNLVRQPRTVPLLEQLHERAPYEQDLSFALLRIKYHQQATYEQAEAVYHPVLEYDTFEMEEVAAKLANNPPAYEALMAKAGALHPGEYYELYEYFAARKDEDKAARYLQRALDWEPDSVSAAARADWMIKYDLKHGETNQAAKLADLAAETYSYEGLLAKANFLEATGDYMQALDYHKKIEERYVSSKDLIKFCLRYKARTGRPDFDETLARRMKIIFPKGIEKASVGDFKQAPVDGVLVGSENEKTIKAGLRRGDVIVALNGVWVHNVDQYLYARNPELPQLDLIVWQDNRYREIQASPPGLSFGVHMPTYAAK